MRSDALQLFLLQREDVISGGQQAAAVSAGRFAHAWQAMRQDSSIQFNLTPAPEQPGVPAWLRAVLNAIGKVFEAIGRFIAWIFSFFPDASYVRIILWLVIGLGAAMLLLALFNRIKNGEWSLRLPRPAPVTEIASEEEWKPDSESAHSWLEEADALAGEGRFAEAIHHLLFRSIDDIAAKRPKLVRPALTSRELAGSTAIPARARELFSSIASMVERSLFGGRAVGQPDWLQAREAYSGFALPSAWRK